jgi:hypothetical protein
LATYDLDAVNLNKPGCEHRDHFSKPKVSVGYNCSRVAATRSEENKYKTQNVVL